MMIRWFLLGLTATITSCGHVYYDVASNEVLSYITSEEKNAQLLEIEEDIKFTEDKIKRWEPHYLNGHATSTETSVYLQAFVELQDLEEEKRKILRRRIKD